MYEHFFVKTDVQVSKSAKDYLTIDFCCRSDTFLVISANFQKNQALPL